MAASEVDLPEPVPPTKITSPRFFMETFFSTSGSFRSSIFGITLLMMRMTRATAPR